MTTTRPTASWVSSIDDHSLVVDDDGSWGWSAGAGTGMGEATCLVDEGFSVVASFCSVDLCDAPSSTSMSCARDEEPKQPVQRDVMRCSKESFRLLEMLVADCLASLNVGEGGVFSATDTTPLPFALALRLLRLDRFVSTGTLSVDAAQEPVSLAQDSRLSFEPSSVVDWWMVEDWVCSAVELDVMCAGEGGRRDSALLIVPDWLRGVSGRSDSSVLRLYLGRRAMSFGGVGGPDGSCVP